MSTKASKTQLPGASLDWADRVLAIVRSLQLDGRTVRKGFGGTPHRRFDSVPELLIVAEAVLPEIEAARDRGDREAANGVDVDIIREKILPELRLDELIEEPETHPLHPDIDYGAYVTPCGHVVEVSRTIVAAWRSGSKTSPRRGNNGSGASTSSAGIPGFGPIG